ncbi:integrase [Embleya sp. NPDC008237]|uniref:integrase n=1 Tax=Embleya sp. NPDC008237 TaxID=3363978 RepID=UPI0036E46D56
MSTTTASTVPASGGAPGPQDAARHASGRLIEFFSDSTTPWARRLWDIGSVLALEELWEAGSWQAAGVLSGSACDWQRNQLSARIGPDRGLGDKQLRRQITDVLKAPLPDPSPGRRTLRQLIDHARPDYLTRWAQAAADAPATIKPERFARALASHLLDLGFSSAYLQQEAFGLYNRRLDLAGIAQACAEIAARPERTFEVLVTLDKVPHRDIAATLDTWRDKGQVSAWLKSNGHKGLRSGGGFVYACRARDPHGAADQARRIVERLIARAAFLRKHRDGVVPHDQVWVQDHPDPITWAPPARGANLTSLTTENHLYRVDGPPSRLDDALELAAPINLGALGPAVAGAWAAVESLLCHPDDPQNENERSGKAIAADRFAMIVACSWPRAELTALAYRHSPTTPDALAEVLETCTSNAARSRVVAEALAVSGPQALALGKSRIPQGDPAAALRMTNMLANPGVVLRDVADTLKLTMRRLYRARNIVLHGGSTQGVALDAALRTAAPILGAGLDRMVHAALVEQLDPLDLAARAEVALQLVGGDTGLTPVDLLEAANARS